MPLIFQYGSNMDFNRISERLNGNVHFVGIARTVERFRFDFTQRRRSDGVAVADLIEDAEQGRQIYGVLYEIPIENIDRSIGPVENYTLDYHEGGNYQRVSIELCWPEGEPITEHVETYFVKIKQYEVKTAFSYVKHILNGLQSHDFPEEYVQYVRERILANDPSLEEQVDQFLAGEWIDG